MRTKKDVRIAKGKVKSVSPDGTPVIRPDWFEELTADLCEYDEQRRMKKSRTRFRFVLASTHPAYGYYNDPKHIRTYANKAACLVARKNLFMWSNVTIKHTPHKRLIDEDTRGKLGKELQDKIDEQSGPEILMHQKFIKRREWARDYRKRRKDKGDAQ